MLCSEPSSGKGGSGSNWLDRLRSSKGLDNVLDSSSSSSSTSSSSKTHRPPPTATTTDNCPCPCENPKAAAAAAAASSSSSSSSSSFAVITGILSDLFYFTPTTAAVCPSGMKKKKKKKFPRKQSSPKILSSPKQLPPPPPPILSSNSHIPHKQRQLLSGFSKTEVTVIDTSSLLWKSDKLIFRRKHLWKIKDNNLNKTNSQPIQEYNAEHCSGPQMSANAPGSSNDKKENAFTPLQENESYDPENKVIS